MLVTHSLAAMEDGSMIDRRLFPILAVAAFSLVGRMAQAQNVVRVGALYSNWNISENKFFGEHSLSGFGICGDLGGEPDSPASLEFRVKVLSADEEDVTVIPVEVGIMGKLKVSRFFRPIGSVGLMGLRINSSTEQKTTLGLYARAGIELGFDRFWLFADYQVAGSGYARTSRNARGIVQRETTQYQGTGLNLGAKYEF